MSKIPKSCSNLAVSLICEGGHHKRLHRAFFGILLTLTLTGSPAMQAEPVDLPLPDGSSIRFQPIFLGIDPNLMAVREFMMGDRREADQASILERLSEARIGGSFLARRSDGKMDWCYYLSETEVNETQWAAVFADQKLSVSNLPKTGVSYHEVQTYISKYNQWLRANQRETIPSNEGTPGFVRLPSEAEWEFACRGGSIVVPEIFDRQVPYSSESDLKRREWVFGSDSSSGKLKPIKSTGKPSVLGLYDMLGNASEMTDSFFSLDHFSGRFGGFVVKGPNVNTLPRQVRSSNRFEQGFYNIDGVPNTGERVGFRLAIGCKIFWNDATAERIANAVVQTPATKQIPRFSLSSDQNSTSDATSAQLTQAEKRIKSLENQIQNFDRELRESDFSKGKEAQIAARSRQQVAQLLAQINLLRADLTNAEATVYQRDRKIAAKSVRMSSRSGRDMVINHERMGIYEKELTPEEKLPWQEHYTLWMENRQQAWEIFEGEIAELHDINQEILDGAFQSFRTELVEGGFREQANALSYIKSLVDSHRKGISLSRNETLDRLFEAEERKQPEAP